MNILSANTIPISSYTFEEIKVRISFRELGSAPEHGTSASLAEVDLAAKAGAVDIRSDVELIELVRLELPDEAALDALVTRYWDTLFARCQMLTLNYEKALDLAQATWCKLLRNRQALKPDGNFPGYLAKIATNLFRDSYRAARRAGPMADHRLGSLDATLSDEEGDGVPLLETVPDLKSLHPEEQILLAIDIDTALERLHPQMREVLIARFIDGESCAEIGHRYGRTEQTVSGWIRAGLRQMKGYLEETNPTHNNEVEDSSREFVNIKNDRELVAI